MFLQTARIAGLYARSIWHATNELEARQIRTAFGKNQIVFIAPNVTCDSGGEARGERQSKTPGSMRVVFVGRINRVKNLHLAVAMISELRGDIVFNIFGPREDETYFDECVRRLSVLPSHIQASYRGPVKQSDIPTVLRSHDLLLLPTAGENFGHVIAESLLVGCPVLVSDQTPWRDLARAHAGWDIPLSDLGGFTDAMQKVVAMDETEWLRLSNGARLCATERVDNKRTANLTAQMFREAVRVSLEKRPEGLCAS